MWSMLFIEEHNQLPLSVQLTTNKLYTLLKNNMEISSKHSYSMNSSPSSWNVLFLLVRCFLGLEFFSCDTLRPSSAKIYALAWVLCILLSSFWHVWKKFQFFSTYMRLQGRFCCCSHYNDWSRQQERSCWDKGLHLSSYHYYREPAELMLILFFF